MLRWAHENATLPSDREHIGPFIERTRERRWKKGELHLFAGMQDVRLTLDEVDDYELLRHILEQVFKVDEPPTASVLNYVRTNPDIQESTVISLEMKAMKFHYQKIISSLAILGAKDESNDISTGKTDYSGRTQFLSKRPEMFSPDNWPAYYKAAKGLKFGM